MVRIFKVISRGCGVVFKVDASGTETVLYNFTSTGGKYPFAGVIRDKSGNLYGTTLGPPYGNVFKLDTSGTESVLYSFTGGSDGGYPEGALVRDTAGNLYGTTAFGGDFNNSNCTTYPPHGCGTVFKVDRSGKEIVLYRFSGGSDGAFPSGGLIRDTAGNLYGTTSNGGKLNCQPPYGCGTVFKLSKTGALTVLHRFAGGTRDGCNAYGTPAMDTAGNLYSTTFSCGSSGGGTVFKVNKTGKETVLHNFVGGSSDGVAPQAGVIIDAKGNLYGDTTEGGSFGGGTVYRLNKKGKLTLLHSFTGGADGAFPAAGVFMDGEGNLYGTAPEGGNVSSNCTDGCGTVWKLTP